MCETLAQECRGPRPESVSQGSDWDEHRAAGPFDAKIRPRSMNLHRCPTPSSRRPTPARFRATPLRTSARCSDPLLRVSNRAPQTCPTHGGTQKNESQNRPPAKPSTDGSNHRSPVAPPEIAGRRPTSVPPTFGVSFCVPLHGIAGGLCFDLFELIGSEGAASDDIHGLSVQMFGDSGTLLGRRRRTRFCASAGPEGSYGERLKCPRHVGRVRRPRARDTRYVISRFGLLGVIAEP